MTRAEAAALGNAAYVAKAAARRAEYQRLRGEGLSMADAALKVGVCGRTMRRYEGVDGAGMPTSERAVAGRREDYAELRDVHGCSVAKAAARMGICLRTAERYEAARRQMAGAGR